jgi:hypothetical protein
MRNRTCTFVLILSALFVGPFAVRSQAQTAFSVSAHVGDFHVAVANYYRVPEREVVVIRERRIPDDEIPVVFFIAQRAAVPPARIIDLRMRGTSWWDISVRYGLSPEVYYVPVAVAPGPPYGKAYGHYKKKHRNEWKTIVLTDADIVNLVELRFLSEHYHVAPERIIELRGSDRDFVAIHADVRGNQHGHGDHDDQGEDRGKSAGNRGGGKGKGRR